MSFTINLDRVISELRAGKPVAIPTETVYGLAAMINRPNAIKAVFELKDRPLNHPLIMHVAKEWDLNEWVEEIPEYAQLLMNKFWPGPLTLIFRSNTETVHPLITGGQTTIAIRCPAHPLAQKLLRKLDTPLVAPSANPFGKISPTTARHVHQSFGDKDLLIYDGGRCSIGIESTIVDATKDESYQILRHGIIDEQAISMIISTHQLSNESLIRAPGGQNSHYQPQKNLYYFERLELIDSFCEQRSDDVYVIARKKPDTVSADHFHLLADDPKTVAFDLYFQLRKADESNAMCIAIELPPDTSEWQGIRERILKAGFPFSYK